MNDPFNLEARLKAVETHLNQLENEMVLMTRKVRTVSGALWCDPGNHAFSANDPDRHRITSENADGETVTVDMCGTHLPSIFRTNPKEIQDS